MMIKITAFKFEIIDGKRIGKSFDFKLDPKKFAKYKTEATVKKQIEAYIVQSGIFKKGELGELKYNMKDFLQEWRKEKSIAEAQLLKELAESPNKQSYRVTPETITRLGENEIFVFGSNARGLHHGGAARTAVECFGAIMGQGHGLQGKSYAINTMSGITEMKQEIAKFCQFASQYPEKYFLVTPIGCGIAGYHSSDVAPLFADCRDMSNVALPESFWKIIGMPQSKVFNLDRFLESQERNYSTALNEIKNGRKCSHWIWYIFPQRKGLGRSQNSKFYGLDGIEEAQAYLAHPVLGERLRTICTALLKHSGHKEIDAIMGSHIDVIKLQSCMNLFNRVAPNDIFKQVLEAFY